MAGLRLVFDEREFQMKKALNMLAAENVGRALGALLLALLPLMAWSAGVVPETSLVVVEEGDGEGVINVKNTDVHASLMYVRLENLPEDPEGLLLASPPISRVEGGEKQLVRFLLKSSRPLQTERLMRASFEGIPAVTAEKGHRIQMTFNQNLPVLIRPKGLPREREPWTKLQWGLAENGMVEVKNDSPYVVRLSTHKVELQPGKQALELPKAYILPGERLQLASAGQTLPLDATHVKLWPATSYGYAVDSFTASLN